MKFVRSLLVAVFFLFAGSFFLTSCELEDDGTPTCTGCSSSSPWSTPDTSTCYATKADCETAEGKTCENCS